MTFSHCVVTGLSVRSCYVNGVLTTTSPRLCCENGTPARSHHVVEGRITLFVRPLGAYHVYGTFAGGSDRAYVTFKEFSINNGSNFSHNYCNGYEHIESEELLL